MGQGTNKETKWYDDEELDLMLNFFLSNEKQNELYYIMYVE